ncbi:MAG: response regulator [Bdellovibrionales bacterium]
MKYWTTSSASGLKGRDLEQLKIRLRHKVLIADDDVTFCRRLADDFKQHGFDCRQTTTISEAKEIVEFWRPDTVFVDLMLPESNALALLKFLSFRRFPNPPKIIVISKQTLPQGIETMRKAGASDYLVKPFGFQDAFRVLNLPSESVGTPSAPDANWKDLRLINLFVKQALQGGAGHQNYFNLMKMISMKVQALRCSLVQFETPITGLVLASNDDENAKGLRVDLRQYPELTHVRDSGRSLIIPNVKTSDILAPVREKIEKTPYETLAVFPVFRSGAVHSALSLRLEQKDKASMFYIEQFSQVCSGILSLLVAGT